MRYALHAYSQKLPQPCPALMIYINVMPSCHTSLWRIIIPQACVPGQTDKTMELCGATQLLSYRLLVIVRCSVWHTVGLQKGVVPLAIDPNFREMFLTNNYTQWLYINLG